MANDVNIRTLDELTSACIELGRTPVGTDDDRRSRLYDAITDFTTRYARYVFRLEEHVLTGVPMGLVNELQDWREKASSAE